MKPASVGRRERVFIACGKVAAAARSNNVKQRCSEARLETTLRVPAAVRNLRRGRIVCDHDIDIAVGTLKTHIKATMSKLDPAQSTAAHLKRLVESDLART